MAAARSMVPATRGAVHLRALRRRAAYRLRTRHLRTLHLRSIHLRTLRLRPCRRGGCRPVLHTRLMIHSRLMRSSGLMIHRRPMRGRRCVMHRGAVRGCGFMIHRRSMRSRRCVMHSGSMRAVNSMGRHAPRMVPGGTMLRHAHAVHMVRIMPVPMIPGGRCPVRHQTGRRNSRNGENSCARRGIPIHRLAVIITINREAIHIITGICPGYRSTPAVTTHPDGCAGIHGVIIHNAGIQQQGRPCKQGNITQLRFHGFMWLSEW